MYTPRRRLCLRKLMLISLECQPQEADLFACLDGLVTSSHDWLWPLVVISHPNLPGCAQLSREVTAVGILTMVQHCGSNCIGTPDNIWLLALEHREENHREITVNMSMIFGAVLQAPNNLQAWPAACQYSHASAGSMLADQGNGHSQHAEGALVWDTAWSAFQLFHLDSAPHTSPRPL